MFLSSLYRQLPALATITQNGSDNQFKALQIISKKNNVAIKCAAADCKGGKFCRPTLEIDSVANQHCRFYNNFVEIEDGKYYFVKHKTKIKQKKVKSYGYEYKMDSNGILSLNCYEDGSPCQQQDIADDIILSKVKLT
jgi:hypothetical protein